MNFSAHMTDACSYAGVGFHFEEGGCFAMAIAMRNATAERYTQGRLAFSRDVVHAFLDVDGVLYDHGGEVTGTHLVQYCSEDDLRAIAASYGHGQCDVDADLAVAADIVATAMELDMERRHARTVVNPRL